MKNPPDIVRSYSSIQVIDRMVLLLDSIAIHGEPASLKFLAAETGLHPSTAFRILASLERHGLVERDAAGRYRLGGKLAELGSRVQRGADIRSEARPVLEALRDQLGETVNLTVREGDQVVYVDRAIANKVIRVEHIIGSRAPLHVTAVGKLFLGEGEREACRDYAERTGLPAYTPNTVTQLAQLQQEVDTARAQGYALDNEEAELGVGCIGAPVRDSSGAILAAISVSAPIERRRDAWAPIIKEAADRLSARLGFHPRRADRPAAAAG